MIKIYRTGELPLAEILLRGEDDVKEIEARVRDIIENVRKEGDKALYRYAEAFAYARVDKEFIAIMEKAAANIREFHSAQVRKDYRIERGGAVLGQRFIPVACAGLYVTGRHGELSVHRSDERNTRQNRGREAHNNVHAARQEREDSGRHTCRR